MGKYQVNTLSGYNKINLEGTDAQKTAFNAMLNSTDADADVKHALEVIDAYGLNISFSDLGEGINGEAEVGGDEIKLDKDLLKDPEKLKDVFAHELAHILGGSHETNDEEDKKFEDLETLLTNGKDDDLQDVFAHYEKLKETTQPDKMSTEYSTDNTKDSWVFGSETGTKNDGVTVSKMTTSGTNNIAYPPAAAGDQIVMSISYSTDSGIPNIDALKADGWTVAYNKGETNTGKNAGKGMIDGEGDIATLVLTKDATGETTGDYEIPTKDGKNKFSVQMMSINGGKVDTSSFSDSSDDDDKMGTAIPKAKTDGAFTAYIGTTDDPAVIDQNSVNKQFDQGSFTTSGDDSGFMLLSKENNDVDVSWAKNKHKQGQDDHGVSFSIVAN